MWHRVQNNLPVYTGTTLAKIMHPEAAVHRAVRHPVEHPQEAALTAAVQVQAAGRQAVHGQAQAVREAVPMTVVPVIRIRMAEMIQAVRTAVREAPVVLQTVDPARRAVLPAVIPAITTIHPQTAGIPQTTVIAAVTPAMVTTAAKISDGLSGIGFTQRYSNVYVCEENDTYYGEIITQPNVTIIYIKQRSGTFDSRIQTVLARLLPDEYGQVWSNYLSANTDRTFTAEGRRVRIVVAPNGGHSQIVIYN